MSTANKPVKSYSEFLAEKIDQNLNLDALKVKGKKTSKEVDTEISKLPKGTGSKPKKEVNPEISKLPKAGKTSTKTVKSNLSNLETPAGKAPKAELDPKFAKMPTVKGIKGK